MSIDALMLAESRRIDAIIAAAANHRTFRLARLDRYLRAAESGRNHPLALAILKQAAEEVGGAYTNKREVSGNGAPLVTIYKPGVLLPDNGRDKQT